MALRLLCRHGDCRHFHVHGGSSLMLRENVLRVCRGVAQVVRHNPYNGSVDYEVKLPMNNPTSCAIGETVVGTQEQAGVG